MSELIGQRIALRRFDSVTYDGFMPVTTHSECEQGRVVVAIVVDERAIGELEQLDVDTELARLGYVRRQT